MVKVNSIMKKTATFESLYTRDLNDVLNKFQSVTNHGDSGNIA